MPPEDELRKKAKKRAEEKIGFYVHFVVYLMVNLLLYVIWWTNGAQMPPWPMWATIGWGIGIVAHFIAMQAATGFEDKLAEKEYQKLKKKK